MGKKKLYHCEFCGKEFFSCKDVVHYCSIDCRHKATRFDYNCDCCGKLIYITLSEKEKLESGLRKHKYCSKECANKGQITSVKKVCEHCGKEFYVCKSFSELQKFCSINCYREHVKPQNKICPML